MKFSTLWVPLFCLILSSCTSVTTSADKTVSLQGGESIVVLRVSPDNYRLQIAPGVMKGEFFYEETSKPNFASVFPENGYVVIKVPAGELLGLTNIINTIENGSMTSARSFAPCGRTPTLTFEAPVGKVIYLTDIRFSLSGDKITPVYAKRIEAAKKYIDENFANLRGKLEQGEAQLSRTGKTCR